MFLRTSRQISDSRASGHGLVHGLLILLMGLMLVACKSDTKLNPLPADAKILAFGDSLTYGTGALPEHSYPVVLHPSSPSRCFPCRTFPAIPSRSTLRTG